MTADLTVAADGRASRVRALANMAVRELGVPVDVLWFRLPKPAPAPPPTLAYLAGGDLVLTIDRGDYYQSGMLIPKGALDRIRAEGLPALRARLVRAAPVLRDVVGALQSFDQVKLLSVQVNRLERWHRPGLLCIGDAAHAMSPAFGVGVNYAVQDAIATANLLAADLRRGLVVTERALARVQRRRRAAGAADAADPAGAAPAGGPPRRPGRPGPRDPARPGPAARARRAAGRAAADGARSSGWASAPSGSGCRWPVWRRRCRRAGPRGARLSRSGSAALSR